MIDKTEQLEELVLKFNDSARKKKAFIKALKFIFKKLSDEDMDAYIEEEMKMQHLLKLQDAKKTLEDKEVVLQSYFDLINKSRFKRVRKTIVWIEEKFYEHAIDNFVEEYNDVKSRID